MKPLEKMLKNMDAYRPELAAAFERLPTDEVLHQPQIEASGTVEVREHPSMGAMCIIRSPSKFGGDRLPAAGHSPAHAKHTHRALARLRLGAAGIDACREKGVIR